MSKKAETEKSLDQSLDQLLDQPAQTTPAKNATARKVPTTKPTTKMVPHRAAKGDAAISTNRTEALPLLFAGEAQPGESNAAAQACNDYLLLGAGRSLTRLGFIYRTWSIAPESAENAPIRTNPHQIRGLERGGRH